LNPPPRPKFIQSEAVSRVPSKKGSRRAQRDLIDVIEEIEAEEEDYDDEDEIEMVMVDEDSGEPIAYEVYEDEFFAQAFYSSMYDAEALK
jgi:hypothetical protein